MHLIEMSSTRQSFKTVRFNRTGLSLVVGKHTAKQSKNIQSTYNGVGKSLLVALLHFCLGSNKNQQFEAHLNGWDFSLVFEHEDKEHRVTRTVGEDKLIFDEKEIKLNPYKEILNDLGIFEIPADVGSITFRALISYFLRPNRASYNSPDAAVLQWTPYYRVLYQSFLLGLDYLFVVQKHDAKKKLDEQIGLAKKYKEDKDLREFYLGEKNAEMELASLKERIAKLEEDLAKFEVAKDYSDREAAANDLRFRIVEARNEETILAIRLSDIEVAISTTALFSLYLGMQQGSSARSICRLSRRRKRVLVWDRRARSFLAWSWISFWQTRSRRHWRWRVGRGRTSIKVLVAVRTWHKVISGFFPPQPLRLAG